MRIYFETGKNANEVHTNFYESLIMSNFLIKIKSVLNAVKIFCSDDYILYDSVYYTQVMTHTINLMYMLLFIVYYFLFLVNVKNILQDFEEIKQTINQFK